MSNFLMFYIWKLQHIRIEIQALKNVKILTFQFQLNLAKFTDKKKFINQGGETEGGASSSSLMTHK